MSETSVKKQPCEPRVAIYPVRYTVIEKQKTGDPTYAYQNAGLDLQTGYPSLQHSQYTMRLLADGFVYMYDETKDKLLLWKITEQGSFIELLANTATLENIEKLYKTGDTQQFLWAPRDSTVYIGFTDSLWTNKTYAAITKNKNGIREKLMTKVNVKSWVGSQKNKHCFIPTKLDQLVEEFKDKNWQENLKWSQRETTPAFNNVTAMTNAMTSYAPAGQIITALHDNIGMVEDQKMLIKKKNDKLLNYTVKHHHKKIIADIIEQIYTQSYAAEKKLSSNKDIEVSISEDIIKRKAAYERASRYLKNNPGYESSYSTVVRIHSEKMIRNKPKTETGYRSEVLANVAKRDRNHIKEKERLKFLKRYNSKTISLSKTHMESKNDRCTLLKEYTKSDKITDLGSGFLNYDLNNPISGGAHAQSFANCMDGMMSDVNNVEGIENLEKKLFNNWWQMLKANNPLLVNLKLDDNLLTFALKNKIDTSSSIISGAQKLADKTLRPFFASTVITQNLAVYSLNKSPKWKGAVLNNIDKMFENLLNAASEGNAKELRTILTGQHQKLTGKYAENVSIKYLSPKEYLKLFGKATKLGDAQVERILDFEGSLKGKDVATITITHVADEGQLKHAIENPFGGKIGAGVTGLTLIMYALNLVHAIDTFKSSEKYISTSNFLSAVFGLGSGLNSTINSMKPILGTHSYSKLIAQNRIIKIFASKAATRVFGYASAIFDGITYTLKSYDAAQKGNNEAAKNYAAAAFFLSAGGAALTYGLLGGALLSNPVGWVIIGIGLLGLGIYYIFKGDGAAFTPIHKWLDSCTFGQHNLPDTLYYKTEEIEYDAFVGAMYAPQIIDVSWNREVIGKEDVTLEIHQPVKDQYYRFAVGINDELPKIDTTIKKNKTSEIRPWNPGKMHTALEDFKAVGNGYYYKAHIKNIPTHAKLLTVCLYYIPILTGQEGKWIKNYIKINRNILFSDYKLQTTR